ncbi:MAG TPA: helix-turn-helix domain-containing protein [Armatimonadota bacterium]|nr:helix-turn-helix domain-containing protein [Armatimonadota bacterium]
MHQINLTDEERRQLTLLRDKDPKAYMRERCAAILKVAQGFTVAQVAKSLLLRRRRHETVADWLQRYKEDGISGLRIRPGRGRKPAFFP